MPTRNKQISRPGRRLIFGFMSIILIGACLLLLPISRNSGVHITLLDALFTATSAVCVTGLVTVDIAATFSVFGRIVIALLIQLGGLGYASIAIFFLVLFGKTIMTNQRTLIREALNTGSGRGLIDLVKTVAVGALLVEALGTVALYFVFREAYTPLGAVGMAAFHAISAFNNAGFDLLGDFQSFTGYSTNVLLNVTIGVLIILGGLGFFVYRDILRKKKWSKLSMHSKIVLTSTATLIVVGMLMFMLISRLTPLEAFFQSVSARTAGFNTVDMTILGNGGLILMMMLMFIGASPGSTGGGIKTTTMFTLGVMMFSVSSKRQPTAFHRRISTESITKALVVVVMSTCVVMLSTMGICIIEGDSVPFSYIMFEAVSAFATVGLSCGITPDLHDGSRIILMLVMFIGRLGPLTIASSVRAREQKLSYVDERILIG